MKKGNGTALLIALALAAGPGLAASPAPKPTPRPKSDAQSNARGSQQREAPTTHFAGELISLDLKDADLRDVIATFGKLEHINVAIDPEVRGSVTIRLQDIPWDQALEVILRSNGFGYLLEGNILRVGMPARLAGP
jgi:type IV pilus assembly protein PilQ